MAKPGRPRKERYARLMGGFWRNEKVRRLSLEARGLLATAWSYAADQATDGKIPIELLEAWAGRRFEAIMKQLAGFLTVQEGAIDAAAHDWTDVNITAEEWEQHLERERERKKGKRHGPAGNPPDPPGGNGGGNPGGNPGGFRGGALDEDEDDDLSSSDRGGGSKPATSRASAATTTTGPAVRSGPAGADVVELRPAASKAERAYRDALERATGGKATFGGGSQWWSAFADVARYATAAGERERRDVDAVLDGWAARYVEERRSRRPDWWLEKVTEWCASADTIGAESDALTRLDTAATDARCRGDYDALDRINAEIATLAQQQRRTP